MNNKEKCMYRLSAGFRCRNQVREYLNSELANKKITYKEDSGFLTSLFIIAGAFDDVTRVKTVIESWAYRNNILN